MRAFALLTMLLFAGMLLAPPATAASRTVERTYLIGADAFDASPTFGQTYQVGRTRLPIHGGESYVDIRVTDLHGLPVLASVQVYRDPSPAYFEVFFCGRVDFNLPGGATHVIVAILDRGKLTNVGHCTPSHGTTGTIRATFT